MERVVWLFHRVESRPHLDFVEHYVKHHAVLGRELCRMLKGYTVNIVSAGHENRGESPDAVTEHWVADVVDFLDIEKNYDSPEDRQRVFEDDRTLIDHAFTKVYVGRDRVVVPGPLPEAVTGERTATDKLVLLYPSAAAAETDIVPGTRVVDLVVDGELVMAERGKKRVPSDIAVIRTAWGLASHTPPPGVRVLAVEEYRQIEAPESI